MPVESKSNRWNFRVAEREDEIVRAAAELAETNITEFVLDAAVSEAKRVLADRNRFELEPREWHQLHELLDREPKVSEGLRRLYARPSAFDE